jgi:pyruvate/2-oxoacid:ferredoxin oxidoreductase alpha subunit
LKPFLLRVEGPGARGLIERLMKSAARSRFPASAWPSSEGLVFSCGAADGGAFLYRCGAGTLSRADSRWELPLDRFDDPGAAAGGALARLAGIEPLGPGSGGDFLAGHEYARANWPSGAVPPAPSAEPLVAIDGEAAIAAACIGAGCGFFAVSAGAPASGARRELSRLPSGKRVRVFEAGDAVAAAFAAAGAGYGGLRAAAEIPVERDILAAPGAAWAASAEVPFVLIVSEPAAPESYGGIVRIPASIHEVYALTAAAFDLAESYQTSATVVVEPAMRARWETMPEPASALAPHRGRWCRPDESPGEPFDRYSDPEDGVSPRSAPGMPGLEHSTCALEGDDEPRRRTRFDKLALKDASLQAAFGPGAVLGAEDGPVVVASGAIAAQLRAFAGAGDSPCGLLPVRTLRPFAPGAVAERVGGRRVLVALDRPDDPLLRLLRADGGVPGAEPWKIPDASDPGAILESLRELIANG